MKFIHVQCSIAPSAIMGFLMVSEAPSQTVRIVAVTVTAITLLAGKPDYFKASDEIGVPGLLRNNAMLAYESEPVGASDLVDSVLGKKPIESVAQTLDPRLVTLIIKKWANPKFS